MGSQTVSQLLVIDFTDENMKPGTEAWLSACRDVRTGFEEHGCFVARYDKVNKEICDSVISAMEQMFELPVEIKSQKTSDKLFHGYLGQVSWLPLYESLGVDDPLTMDGCEKFAQIMWPQGGNKTFCETVNEYSKVLGALDQMAKRMVFESYGVDMHRCDSFLESSDYLLRCMKYRPPKVDENDLGMHSHSDLTIISIVHQLNNLNGLEIKLNQDGDGDGEEWAAVDASPSSFVVMAGDAFKVWSNGRIRPCVHRVIMNAEKTRYSMGLFSFGSKTVNIPDEVVNEQHPLRYKQAFDHYDYLRFFDHVKIKEADPRIQAYCGI